MFVVKYTWFDIAGKIIAQLPKNYTKIFREVHKYLLKVEKELFKTQGASGASGKWADYSSEPKYAKFKKAKTGRLTPILTWRRKSLLKNSLTIKKDPNHVFKNGKYEMIFGTSVKYAKDIANGGTNNFGEQMPARPIISLTEDNRETVRSIIQAYIELNSLKGFRTRIKRGGAKGKPKSKESGRRKNRGLRASGVRI